MSSKSRKRRGRPENEKFVDKKILPDLDEQQPRQHDDEQLDSVYSMPKLDSAGHYTNKDYKPDPSDVNSWQKSGEPTEEDKRPAKVIKRLMEFYETDVTWEYIHCFDCNKVIGQRQQRIEVVQIGGKAVIYCLPDRIRCLDCRDAARGKYNGKEKQKE